MDSNGDHVNLGNFDKNGLNVNNWYDNNRNSNIGLASARNSVSEIEKETPLRAFLLINFY